MQLDPRYEPPSAPDINVNSLSIEERIIGQSIYSNLASISSEATSIAAAVALFGVCQDRGGRDLFGDWMRLAARDGAMSIRNFGEALASVRSLIGRVKVWLPLIDTKALKAVETHFNEVFPFAHKLRHSVAHPEFYNDPTKKMGISGDLDELGVKAENVGNLTIKAMISDSTYASTFEGVLVRYDLTTTTIDAVSDLTHRTFNAFALPDERGKRTFPPRQSS